MLKNLLPLSVRVTLLALLLCLPAAAEDLTIVSQVTGGKGKPTTSTQYITTDKMRTGDGRNDTIMDLESGRIIQVDHKKKTYHETSLEEIRAHFAELERMLDENPMMAAMIGGATEVTVREGTETREVAGYTCNQYFLTIGKLEFEVFAAGDLKVPIEYYDAQKMVYAAMGPMASRFDKMYDELKEIGGVTLYTKIDSRFIGMKIKNVSEATEVRKGPIPADTFEPPAGYKKKKSPYEEKKK
ncbi:MAG: DUF4412 domain-containing protein [bacterium]|nr:DUF4412 domain-containing protein [bacterium]